MFRSLRFRLPALFLAGIVVSGLIAATIAFGLFQDAVLDRSRAELRREAAGLTQLYAEQANKTGAAPGFVAKNLELATGDRLYYVGESPFVFGSTGLRRLPRNTVDWQSGKVTTFE